MLGFSLNPIRQLRHDVRRVTGHHGSSQHHKSKIKPYTGTPPFPAPQGTAWVMRGNQPRLIIPGGALAKKIVTRQLRAAGLIGKQGKLVASPVPETAYPAGYPTPAPGPEAGVVSTGAPAAVPTGFVQDYSTDYLPAQLPSDLSPMPDALEPGEGSDFPEYEGDPVLNVPAPAGVLADRSVYGTTHLPSDYAQLYQGNEGYADPYEGGSEGTLFPTVPDTDAQYSRDSAALDELETGDTYGGAFNDGLSGISDILGGLATYWQGKWDSAVAYFEARIGEFMGLKEKLLAARDTIGVLQAKAEHSSTVSEADSQAIRDMAATNTSLIAKQGDLETQIQDAAKQIGLVKQQQKAQTTGAGLGFIPLIIGAAAVAAILTVAGAVVYHMQSVKSHLADLEALKNRVLTPAELSAVNAATGGGMFADLFKGLGGLIALGGIAYLIFSYNRSK